MDEINQSTYEAIAKEFSDTRHSVWKCVKDFSRYLTSTTDRLHILEVGCGNGKNMDYIRKQGSNIIGIDSCERLIDICKRKGLNAIHGNSKKLPFPNNCFDSALCIAMFHHLLIDRDRDASFGEILRVLKPKGRGILTCWSTLQPEGSKRVFAEGVNRVLWNGQQVRYYYGYSEVMFREYFQSFSDAITIETIYNEKGNWILIFKKK
jgi:tRNA (uracil-5-)-methyltransferase TRM9